MKGLMKGSTLLVATILVSSIAGGAGVVLLKKYRERPKPEKLEAAAFVASTMPKMMTWDEKTTLDNMADDVVKDMDPKVTKEILAQYKRVLHGRPTRYGKPNIQVLEIARGSDGRNYVYARGDAVVHYGPSFAMVYWEARKDLKGWKYQYFHVHSQRFAISRVLGKKDEADHDPEH